MDRAEQERYLANVTKELAEEISSESTLREPTFREYMEMTLSSQRLFAEEKPSMEDELNYRTRMIMSCWSKLSGEKYTAKEIDDLKPLKGVAMASSASEYFIDLNKRYSEIEKKT